MKHYKISIHFWTNNRLRFGSVANYTAPCTIESMSRRTIHAQRNRFWDIWKNTLLRSLNSRNYAKYRQGVFFLRSRFQRVALWILVSDYFKMANMDSYRSSTRRFNFTWIFGDLVIFRIHLPQMTTIEVIYPRSIACKNDESPLISRNVVFSIGIERFPNLNGSRSSGMRCRSRSNYESGAV